MLPTGKSLLSYSEIKHWLDCSWRHKLLYVDKLGKYEKSIFTDFGGIIHDSCEEYLKTKTQDKEAVLQKIRDVWEERGYPNVPGWPTYASAVPDLQYWLDTAECMLEAVPEFLKEHFEDWEFVEAEERLRVPIDGTSIEFKGFIDGIIKVKRKDGSYVYWIIDWKTSGPAGWRRDKLQDFTVHLQLMLYKIFWGQHNNIPQKDIKCGFILLKRLDPKTKKKKVMKPSFVPVSVGPKTTERTLRVIRNMIRSLTKSVYLKNKFECDFCEFRDTSHCKINL